ncbi:MAG TPA: hypothetical protein VLH58_11045 [Candidatus Methylomirabilis sp.]|nr:hypothetical protein [Candidatus Methylomirabilis sp.]
MHTVFQRIRGSVAVALTWAASWALLGALLGMIYGVLRPQDVDPGETPLAIAKTLGIAGFISGTGFALMLSFLERGRALRDVAVSRVALWGALGGAIVPLLTAVSDSQVLWTSPLGALLATSTIAVARRGERLALNGSEGRASPPGSGCHGGP